MNLLIFEFICGGGLAKHSLPEHLAAEGRLMLQALLDDLKELTNIELIIPLDRRIQRLEIPACASVIWIDDTTQDDFLSKLIEQVDAVWPIAPDSQNILSSIAELVESQNKTLLLSSAATVRLCSNKLDTIKTLSSQGLACVPTTSLDQTITTVPEKSVIKPTEGISCEGSWIIEPNTNCRQLIHNLDQYIIQPYIEGESLSLSCLFQQGQGWLLTINNQLIQARNHSFVFLGCEVNELTQPRQEFQSLVNKLAKALPGLWGYVGIDLIKSQNEILIMEINPRLTTSYAGIKAATGFNVAKLVLELNQKAPLLEPTHNRTIRITLNEY